MEQLKGERENLETTFKSLSFDFKTPFLQTLQEGSIDEPVISTQILGHAFALYDPVLKASLEKQESLIAAIQSNSDEYFGRRGGVDETDLSRRDQVIRQLAEAYDAFIDLQSNVQEGTKFYNDLTQVSQITLSSVVTRL